MTSNAVAGFVPSSHGFRFANSWPPGPTIRLGLLDPRLLGIGDASSGLCGGMALTARDLFEARLAMPIDTMPFINGSPRFAAIVRRQVQSLDWLRVPLRYYALQALHTDPPGMLGRLLHRDPARVVAVRDEWRKIKADIDCGHLSIVGLIRASGFSIGAMSQNHQVVAFAYDEQPDQIRIRIYDPNHPGGDDVAIIATRDGGPETAALAQSTGEGLRGFFRQPYPPPRSLAAWR